MEIFQLLDKSNCRDCGQKTCLAFAGAVFRDQTTLDRCPRLDQKIIERFSGDPEQQDSIEENREEYINRLKAEISHLDLDEAAQRTGGRVSNNKLTLKVLDCLPVSYLCALWKGAAGVGELGFFQRAERRHGRIPPFSEKM